MVADPRTRLSSQDQQGHARNQFTAGAVAQQQTEFQAPVRRASPADARAMSPTRASSAPRNDRAASGASPAPTHDRRARFDDRAAILVTICLQLPSAVDYWCAGAEVVVKRNPTRWRFEEALVSGRRRVLIRPGRGRRNAGISAGLAAAALSALSAARSLPWHHAIASPAAIG